MTREEAIKTIMSATVWTDEEREALAILIPELAKSEDERIRKELIGALMWQRDCLDAKGPHDNELILPGFTMKVGDILTWLEKQKEQKHYWSEEDKEALDMCLDAIPKAWKTKSGILLTKWLKDNIHLQPKQEWSEEDEKKLERVDDLLWMLDDYLGNDCSICEEKTARLRDEIHNELFPWLEFLRPQYHGDVTMTEAYKMGLEAGKASSWKPSEKQTNNVIVELTRIELGDIINGLYYLKEKYYEDCKEHNGTATMGLSDEFKFYFKRFNEVLDLYTRLHELEKEKYGTTTDGYYYE